MRLAVVLVFFALAPSLAADTIWVPDDHQAIQTAILAASDGDEVVVRPGTYAENIDFLGKAIVVRSESGPSVTTIDGNFQWSVVEFDSGEGKDSVLDGFTVQNGTGNTDGTPVKGGGIYCVGTSPTIINNVVCNNTAHHGAGIYLEDAEGRIEGNEIRTNTTTSGGNGGGIMCWDASPNISGNTIALNTAGTGGGIHCQADSSPTVANNTISENTATAAHGGGIYCGNSSPTITDNTIVRNEALAGGGIYCLYSYPAITGSTITENEASNDGGGICCYISSSPVIANSIITGNQAGVDGGGIYCSSNTSCPTIANSTITMNMASVGGAFCCRSLASAYITNSILWSNSASSYQEIYGSPTVTYSCIEGGWLGAGNINADPLWVDPASGDFHLQQDPCQPGIVNPCVDAGDPASEVIDGTTRTDWVQDSGAVDMGYHYTPSLPNLSPWRPSGWSSTIVTSDVPGTSVDSILVEGATAYIDFAEVNEGGPAVTHTTRLSVDGLPMVDEAVPALEPLGVQEWHDVTYVFPSPGTYRILLEVDVFDEETNESDETDNDYWRDVEAYAEASATSRNAGSNPASYTAITLPVLGSTYTGEVKLAGTTWHTYALLVGYSSPVTWTLGGGQVLLVNILDPFGELLSQPFMPGPTAMYNIPIPADISYAGFQAYTQALHIGGYQPFALSNAQDLTLGY